jgi:hypothetical protein
VKTVVIDVEDDVETRNNRGSLQNKNQIHHPSTQVPACHSNRVANLGDFSPKNANFGIILAFGELGDFLGNFKSQL